MRRNARRVLTACCVVALGILAATPRLARADIVCPDASYVTVSFATTKDRITIAPDARLTAIGETFQGLGITIRVYLRNCSGVPLVGVPAQEIVLFNSGLCFCPGGNIADAPTDVNGRTTFSGTILGGGCASSLSVFADGVAVGIIPVRVNSPDAVPASPCFVDASDIAGLASRLGSPTSYTICIDFNEDGIIDASDVAYFGYSLGAQCQ